jgi:uncharacterized protein with von Willebrand factor type A (vWA) domain
MAITFPAGYIYRQRDQADDEAFDPEEIMDAISEDLLRDGNVELALQKAFRWGFQTRDGNHIGGMREMLQRLRQQRQEMLDRHNFGSVFDDLKDELDDILRQERTTLEQRKDAAQKAGEEGAQRFLERQEAVLDSLSPDPADQIRRLRDYEFVDQEAQQRFSDLLQQLEQQVSDGLFKQLMDAARNPEGSLQQLRDFLKDVNDAFDQDRAGEPVDLDKLNNKWAQQMGGRVNSMEELAQRLGQQMQASQQLLGLLSPEQRQEIEGLINEAAQGSDLAEQMRRLQQNLPPSAMPGQMQQGEPGSEPISLEMAMELLEQLGQIDQLESQLREVGGYDELDGLDQDLLDRVLSDEDKEWMRQWNKINEDLEDAGFVVNNGRNLELTPRAIRKIGEKALEDIFSNITNGNLGQHETRHPGRLGELDDTSSQWQFGDPFSLNLPRTVMNGVMRNGKGAPVHLKPEDFEVIDHDLRTSTATVMLIDLSRSMLHNGCWDAAKRAALALDTLIRSKYPRDMLELIGFSATAHRLTVKDLPTLEWNEYNFGTNLQHGLQMGREILARERGRHRQMIVITDGEPTAHISHGEVKFDYPPTRETFEETLKEVVRCTRDDIRINTFLLEQSPYMRRFVEDLMRINHGRVINASPRRLGSYMLHDFVQGRTVDRRPDVA